MGKLLALIGLLGIYGCADMLTYRSYQDEMERQTDGFWEAGEDFPVVAGDSGQVGRSAEEIDQRTPASVRIIQERKHSRSVQEELLSKERELSKEEFNEYSLARPYLEDTSEKIYYLNLPREERAYYLMNRRALDRTDSQGVMASSKGREEITNSFTLPELYIGMNKAMVIRSWGGPTRVDVAGNPKNQNERWVFYRNGRAQYVYFESGEVRGWAL